MKYMWKHACRASSRVITISEYCKRDLSEHYPTVEEKCCVIYNPVETGDSGLTSAVLEEKYGIRENEYFYCVSSMLPHKNLETLLRTIALRKQKGKRFPWF